MAITNCSRPGVGGLAAGAGVPAGPRRRRPDTGAARARQRVATFAVDGEVRFASAADRAAFAEELAGHVAGLVARYHTPAAAAGRDHRLVVALHPSVKTETKEP